MAAAAPEVIAGSHKYWHPAVKPGTTKAITTYSQWVSAFSVYAAVLNELYPRLFKHVSDIREMEQQFGGTVWKLYDESFRRER